MRQCAWMVGLASVLVLGACAEQPAGPGEQPAEPGTVSDGSAAPPSGPQPPPVAPVVDAPAPTAEQKPLHGLGSCRAQLRWWHEVSDYGTFPGYFGISPDGTRLFRAHGYYDVEQVEYRLSDGVVLAGEQRGYERPVWERDAGWRYEVDLGHAALSLRTVVGQRELLQVDGAWQDAQLDARSERLFAARCDGADVEVRGWRVPEGSELGSARLAQGCHNVWLSQLVVGSDDDAVLVALSDGALWRVDLAQGRLEEGVAQAHGEPSDPEVYWHDLVPGAHRSPDGTRLATIGLDGWLHVWTLPGLELLAGVQGAATALLNQYIYAGPFGVAALAFSRDGALLAHADTDGRVVLRRASDASEVARLELPESTPLTSYWPGSLPAALAFSPDGRALAVSTEAGVGVFACAE